MIEVWVKNEVAGSVPFQVDLKLGGNYDHLKRAIKVSKGYTFGHDEITLKNPDTSEIRRIGHPVQEATTYLMPYLFSAPPHVAVAQSGEIIARLERLENRLRNSVDERISYWTNAVPNSAGKHSVASNFCKETYHSECVFCGVKDSTTLPVTTAHLVTSGCSSYAIFGPAQYKDPLNVKSPRNFIPLCGGTHESHPGSCHDLFDKYLLTLVYNPFGSVYQIICLGSHGKLDINGQPLHEKILNLRHEPYRRLLAWRTRYCLIKHGYSLPDQGEQLLLASNLSEECRSIAPRGDEGTERSSDA